MNTSELRAQINAVAGAREETRLAKEIVSAARITWESDNKDIIEKAATLGEELAIDESMLRDLTLKAYAETGNKTPEVGLGIRVMTRLAYDNQVAVDWALEHKLALKLDTSTFEKIAKTNSLPFVTISEEPQATIATDLQEIK